jgi:GT2 family glycosyltransferase
VNVFPRVGIIYLTFATPHWERDISRCLSSLEKISYPKDNIELICVESKSNLGRVQEWFEQTWLPKSGRELPRMTYLYADQVIGFAGNNNRGFEKAKEFGCEYVYLLNEDTEVDSEFLTKAVERAEQDSSIAIVQSFILLGQDRERVNTVGNAFHYLGFGYSNGYLWTRERAERYFLEERNKNPDLEIGYASGAGMLARISSIPPNRPLFDERMFSYHEDTDASLQARLHGWKVVVEPSSVIFHYYEEAKTQLKKNYLVERNRWVLLFSIYRPWTLFVLMPMLLAMEVGSFFFALKGGWWREKLRVYRDLVSNDFWQWMKERLPKIQKERIISDRALLSHAVATIEFQGVAIKNPVLTYLANPLMRGYGWIAKRLLF